MVNVSNAITTEYSYQALASQDVTAQNSNALIIPQGQGSNIENSVEENKEPSKTPQKDQLVKLCAKYHINFRELFGCDYSTLDETACEKYVKLIESSIDPKTGEFNSKKIENIKTVKNLCEQLGVNPNAFNNCEVENLSAKELQNLADALNLAIEHATSDNKLDKEKAVELARKYNTALMTGYSIKELKENKNKLNGESISARIERFFGLEKGAFSKLDDAKKTEYIQRYFNGYFQELLAKAKKEGKDIKSVYRLQMRDFGKLLINTPDEDKAIFKAAINSLLADNRLDGVFATKASFRTQKALTAWADSWTVEEKAALKSTDELGKVISDEDLSAIQIEIGEEQSQEGFEKSHNELNEKVKILLEKVKNGEELTEQEKLLLVAYKSLYAGENIALVQNDIITDKNWKNEFLKQINIDIYEHGEDVYKDVMNQVKATVENHPEILEMPQEDITKALDAATDGNYTRVMINEEIVAPQVSTSSASTTAANTNNNTYSTNYISDIVNTKPQPDTAKLYNLENTIQANSEDNKKPELTMGKNPVEYSMSEIYSSTSKFDEYRKATGQTYIKALINAGKDFPKLTNSLKEKVLTLVELQKNNRIQLLQRINNSQLTVEASKIFDISSGDLNKLSLATCFKQIIENRNEKKEAKV